MSQPAYGHPLPASAIIDRLALATRHPSHEFWPADISLLDPDLVDPHGVWGPKQVTDLYLLALAVHHDGCFATFESSIPSTAVHGARAEHLIVI
jgi:predicted nucleic acid-binding protein